MAFAFIFIVFDDLAEPPKVDERLASFGHGHGGVETAVHDENGRRYSIEVEQRFSKRPVLMSLPSSCITHTLTAD
jgi:hypothetical protein